MFDLITFAGQIRLPQQQVSTFFHMDTLISVTNCHELFSKIDSSHFPVVQDKINKIINEHGSLATQTPATILEENLKILRSELVNYENKKLAIEHYQAANSFKAVLEDLELKLERERRALNDTFEIKFK
ncbi:hypothetical protein NPIL_237421 [Nephila pilipes]|uniref:Uncharacterized protein n=1 Tax=Nephila pilipes TaxID=299642 RepID=A0A8X6PYX1_NEPPI|nr:hypothetical protein NPIL_237421 [Nephila pilipes]